MARTAVTAFECMTSAPNGSVIRIGVPPGTRLELVGETDVGRNQVNRSGVFYCSYQQWNPQFHPLRPAAS